jgi:NADH dehydrogenase FAD-containing subunit
MPTLPCAVVAAWVLVAMPTAQAWITTTKISIRSSPPGFVSTERTHQYHRFGTLVTNLSNENGVSPTRPTSPASTTTLSNERLLRDELEVRNSEIPNEERYAVADGSGLERLLEPTPPLTPPPSILNGDYTATTTAASSSNNNSNSQLRTKMQRLVQPRAYPLFLLEKATEIVESAWHDASTMIQDALTTWNNGEWNDVTTTYAPPASNDDSQKTKERIVILGTGWGAASFLPEIDTELYDVTVVSPRNHFVFTPMLAGASVGTVGYAALCQPVRELNPRVNFLEATATSIIAPHHYHNTNGGGGGGGGGGGTVTCDAVVCEGNSCVIDSFDVSYDRLIVSVGCQTNTFGVPGVRERCNFLKSVTDARRIKSAMVNCFERANLPHLTEAERVQGLTFAVIGAGPTGIEFAAELRDFVEQDGPKYYPHLLKYVRIKVIEASSTILAPFDKSLQEEAVKQMQRQMVIQQAGQRTSLLPDQFELVELLLDSSVSEVGENTIFLKDGRKIPYGLAVWAAGNGPIPLTLQVIEALGREQAEWQNVGRGRIAIDPWMRAVGGNGRIFSLGDCSCIVHTESAASDSAGNDASLPATAQVAAQQGEYLAKLFNKQYNVSPERTADGILPPPQKVPEQTQPTLSDAIAGLATANFNGEFAKAFQFLNLGILAYTGGGSALAQVKPAPNADPVKGSGKLGNAVWKSVYLSKQVSWRNRLLVLNDWTNRQIFGRDITRL